jgi:hypothetical protein
VEKNVLGSVGILILVFKQLNEAPPTLLAERLHATELNRTNIFICNLGLIRAGLLLDTLT